MIELPPELIYLILDFLRDKEKMKLCLTCKYLYLFKPKILKSWISLSDILKFELYKCFKFESIVFDVNTSYDFDLTGLKNIKSENFSFYPYRLNSVKLNFYGIPNRISDSDMNYKETHYNMQKYDSEFIFLTHKCTDISLFTKLKRIGFMKFLDDKLLNKFSDVELCQINNENLNKYVNIKNLHTLFCDINSYPINLEKLEIIGDRHLYDLTILKKLKYLSIKSSNSVKVNNLLVLNTNVYIYVEGEIQNLYSQFNLNIKAKNIYIGYNYNIFKEYRYIS
jgi:hypothetical protein